MRTIPLKSVPFQPIGVQTEGVFVYADMMRVVLLSGRSGSGISTEEGMQATDIAGRIKSSADNGQVVLEEAEYAFLCTRLLEFRWASFDEAVADFVKEIRGAVRVDPNSSGAV